MHDQLLQELFQQDEAGAIPRDPRVDVQHNFAKPHRTVTKEWSRLGHNALLPSIRSNMTSITELAIPETILARLRDRAGKGPFAPPRPVTPSIEGHLPAQAQPLQAAGQVSPPANKPLLAVVALSISTLMRDKLSGDDMKRVMLALPKSTRGFRLFRRGFWEKKMWKKK